MPDAFLNLDCLLSKFRISHCQSWLEFEKRIGHLQNKALPRITLFFHLNAVEIDFVDLYVNTVTIIYLIFMKESLFCRILLIVILTHKHDTDNGSSSTFVVLPDMKYILDVGY